MLRQEKFFDSNKNDYMGSLVESVQSIIDSGAQQQGRTTELNSPISSARGASARPLLEHRIDPRRKQSCKVVSKRQGLNLLHGLGDL